MHPAPADAPVLSARRVGYEQFGRPLLRHLTFVVRRGQVTAVCGPRGSGKTTLVRLLVGELAATRGRIEPAALRTTGARRDVCICNQRDARSFARTARDHAAPTVLFDDPFDGLDPAERHELWTLLRELATHKAVVVTARDPAIAANADRVLLLAAGTAVADGPPAAVLDPALLRLVFGHEFAVVTHPSTRAIALLDVR
jgi:iron complex transport system ATP-binding protein